MVGGARGQLPDRAERGPAHERVLRGLQLLEGAAEVADEARVVHREGGLPGQGGERRLVAAGERARAAVEGPEQRDRLARRVGDRDRDHAHDALGPRPLRDGGRALEAGVGEVVVGALRPLLPQGQAGQAVARLEAHRLRHAHARARGGDRLERAGARVHPRAGRPVGAEQGRDLAHHRPQRGDHVRRGEGVGGHPLEGLDLGQPSDGLRVKPRVADGNRRGGGQGLREGHLGRPELAALPRHAREDPDHLFVEQDRHAEERGEALGLEPGALLEPPVLLHVGQDQGLAVGEHPAHQRRARGHLLGGGQRRADAALVGGEPQHLARLVEQPDARHLGLETGAGERGEAIEHLGEVERRGEQASRLGEDLQLLRARIAHRIGGRGRTIAQA